MLCRASASEDAAGRDGGAEGAAIRASSRTATEKAVRTCSARSRPGHHDVDGEGDPDEHHHHQQRDPPRPARRRSQQVGERPEREGEQRAADEPPGQRVEPGRPADGRGSAALGDHADGHDGDDLQRRVFGLLAADVEQQRVAERGGGADRGDLAVARHGQPGQLAAGDQRARTRSRPGARPARRRRCGDPGDRQHAPAQISRSCPESRPCMPRVSLVIGRTPPGSAWSGRRGPWRR